MQDSVQQAVLRATGAASLAEGEVIQQLWSGYGLIQRCTIKDNTNHSVIVKHVQPFSDGKHPRGWNSSLSHQRKLESYKVETHWYENWNQLCTEACRTPQCLAVEEHEHELLIVLEDLDAAGFPIRKSSVTSQEMHTCLSWLAAFHARFMGQEPAGLWKVGTYWHLATRPEELEVLDDLPLKAAAPAIDKALNDCPYLTFVHGDAKLANFCFSRDGQRVAAVDFQYVGGGCGMKDVAYFIGSCLNEHECERREKELLDYYFDRLEHFLGEQSHAASFEDIEQSWRSLYPAAWTDFHRFLKGWCPEHWKINTYSERLSSEVIKALENEKKHAL